VLILAFLFSSGVHWLTLYLCCCFLHSPFFVIFPPSRSLGWGEVGPDGRLAPEEEEHLVDLMPPDTVSHTEGFMNTIQHRCIDVYKGRGENVIEGKGVNECFHFLTSTLMYLFYMIPPLSLPPSLPPSLLSIVFHAFIHKRCALSSCFSLSSTSKDWV